MKLTLEYGEVSLPKNFAFQIKSTHPFFSDEGTATVPATVPPSPENMMIFSAPTEIHRRLRAVKIYYANLQSGLFNKNCKVVLDSASLSEGINISLALEESDMYVTVRDKKLTDLFFEQVVTQRTYFYERYLNDQISAAPILNKLVLFPVAAGLGDGNVPETILNNVGDSGFIVPASVTISGETVTAPAGYSVTPFIFLWALIEETFTRCGYTVVSNVFKTTTQLKDITVVNNCADVFTSFGADNAAFNLSQIVPNITVGDFIKFLRDKFGAVVSVSDRYVSVSLIDDILAANADDDLSTYLRGGISISYPEAKTLRIGCDTGNDGADPAGESFEKLVSSYKDVEEVGTKAEVTGPGFFFVQSLCRYYHKTANVAAKQLGTEAFDYSRTIDADVDTEEIRTDDLFVSMVEYQGKFIPLIDKAVRRNMAASDVDAEYEQKIQLCYAHFDEHFHGLNHIYATYDDDDEVVIDDTIYAGLHPEGLYKRFWSRYHKLVLDGAPELSCTLDIPMGKLLAMNLLTPKHINGVKVIIKELTYNLSRYGVSSCEALLQQLPVYTDSLDIVDPEFGSTLHWHLVSTRSKFPSEIVKSDGLTDYTEDDAPQETPAHKGITVKWRERWFKYKFTYSGHRLVTHKHTYVEYFISE